VTRQGKPAAGCLSPVVSLRPRTAFTRWKEIPLPRSSRAGRGRRGLRLAPAGLRHGTWRARLTVSGSTRPTSSWSRTHVRRGIKDLRAEGDREAVRPGRGSPLPSSGVFGKPQAERSAPRPHFASLASHGFLRASARAGARQRLVGARASRPLARGRPVQFTITGVMSSWCRSSWCRCRSLSRAPT
jgi:hypothetical protein